VTWQVLVSLPKSHHLGFWISSHSYFEQASTPKRQKTSSTSSSSSNAALISFLRPVAQCYPGKGMESTHLPTFSKSDTDLPNLAPSLRHPNPVSLRRLAECDETDRHTGAKGCSTVKKAMGWPWFSERKSTHE
jgi:hypothetical protein